MGSDGFCSSVEDEPLLWIMWHVVLDSQLVLSATDVVVIEDRPSVAHSGSQLELDAIIKRLLVEKTSLLVNPPGLVLAVMARPPDNMSVVSV